VLVARSLARRSSNGLRANVWHRAQHITLFARFATRQTNAPLEQLLARDPLQQPQDREGSLVDADMGAYYTWINQSRLAGAEQSRFLAWFEDHEPCLRDCSHSASRYDLSGTC